MAPLQRLVTLTCGYFCSRLTSSRITSRLHRHARGTELKRTQSTLKQYTTCVGVSSEYGWVTRNWTDPFHLATVTTTPLPRSHFHLLPSVSVNTKPVYFAASTIFQVSQVALCSQVGGEIDGERVCQGARLCSAAWLQYVLCNAYVPTVTKRH